VAAGGYHTVIRDITGDELRLFGDIVARLERLGPDVDARSVIFADVIRLLRGDFGASYIWDSRKQRFDEALSFNMAPGNLRRYEDWYQFRDPMTFQLRARRRATLVDEVIPRERLMRTEFYNDFLARDADGDDAQIHPHHAVRQWNQKNNARPLGADQFAKSKDHRPFVFAQNAHRAGHQETQHDNHRDYPGDDSCRSVR